MARILIAEDDFKALEAFRGELIRVGHHVRTCQTGREALILIKQCPPFDLIITTNKMPFMDGFELLAELKLRDYDAAVIFMTDSGFPVSEQHAREVGIIAMTKPISPESLLIAVEKTLKLSKTLSKKAI